MSPVVEKSATNSALLSLGEAWGAEVASDGVLVMTVCPGGMKTNFQRSGGVKEIEGEKLMAPEDRQNRQAVPQAVKQQAHKRDRRDAFAERDDEVAGLERQGFLVERRVLEQAEHDAARLEPAHPALRHEKRRVVPRVAVAQHPARQVEHAAKDRDKHAGGVLGGEQAIGLCHAGGHVAGAGNAAHHRARHRHEQ